MVQELICVHADVLTVTALLYIPRLISAFAFCYVRAAYQTGRDLALDLPLGPAHPNSVRPILNAPPEVQLGQLH